MSEDSPDFELVDVLDDNGRVVDTVPRHQMRSERLAHRSTFVALVRGPDLTGDELIQDIGLSVHTPLVVHQRADWKDVYPSYWDVAFGGVCGAGEGWDVSARRELLEEAGVQTGLVLLSQGEYRDETSHTFGRIYLGRSDAELHCDDGEVVQVDEVAVGELARWADGRRVCPDSRHLVLPVLADLLRSD